MITPSLLFASLMFCALMLAFVGAYQFWSGRHGADATKFSQRLNFLGKSAAERATAVSILKQDGTDSGSWSAPLKEMMPGWRKLAPLLRQSGLGWGSAHFVSLTLLGMTLALGAGLLFKLSALWCALLVAAAMPLPLQYVRIRRNRRFEQIEEQLPNALEVMSGALRAGHALSGTFSLLSEEVPAPLGPEFGIVSNEIIYGIGIPEALSNFVQRVPAEDLHCFSIAVIVQRETGGNLSEILTKLSARIRERLVLRGKIRILSSEGRMSAIVLTVLPIVMLGIIRLVSPDYIKPFWVDPIGIALTKLMLLLLIVGTLRMRRQVKIEV